MLYLGGIPLSGRMFLRGRIAKVDQYGFYFFYQTPRSHNRRMTDKRLLLCEPNVNSIPAARALRGAAGVGCNRLLGRQLHHSRSCLQSIHRCTTRMPRSAHSEHVDRPAKRVAPPT
jgi:hypothetical protein